MKAPIRYSGSKLGAILKAQGRRRDWLAKQVGISPSYVTHIAAGRRVISPDLAERISAILGVPLFLAFEVSDSSEKVLSDTGERAA